MCKVLRVKKTNFFDVFFGEGWKEHSRVHYINATIALISGLKLTRFQKYQVEQAITTLVTEKK